MKSLKSTPVSGVSGELARFLEKWRDNILFRRVRTHIRNRSPRLEASSYYDNVGKGSRQIRSVTSGKRLALKVKLMGPCTNSV